MRFETEPGEQAQVDWGSLSYIGADGKQRRVWVFVMTLGWSRACYVELVRKADTAAFIQCHVNAFEYLGGVPRRVVLYDNAKVVTLGRDEEKRPIWNQRMLDFALRVGFEARLCQPYRAQPRARPRTGSSTCGVTCGRASASPTSFDLNRQGLEWCDVVANARVHGTTHRVPWEMLEEERPHLGKPRSGHAGAVPAGGPQGVRDGFVSWGGFRYVHWKWVGATVQVGERQGTVEIWAGDERIAIPGRNSPSSASSCPASGRACPGVTIGKRRWRCRFPRARWNAARWKCTSWWREVWHDRLEQVRQYLETLGLKQAVEVLDNTLDAAANRQLPYPEMLAELLGVEVAARRERCTRLAHLPFQRTFEQFDFFQPSIDERLVKELANLAFVAEATNVLLLGPPGVGKTHLAIALALRASRMATALTSSAPTT